MSDAKLSGSQLQSTTDCKVWAEQFNIVAQDLGYPKMDEGWLIAWFANAMFAQEMAYQRKAESVVDKDPETEGNTDNFMKGMQLAGQCWCDPDTSHLVMEPVLGEAFAKRYAPILDKVDLLEAENAKLREELEQLQTGRNLGKREDGQ
jgi:hypothetical protein